MSEDVNCSKCNKVINPKTKFDKHSKDPDSGNPESILDVSAKNWEEEILQSSDLVLVEFWHKTCPSCQRLAPIYTKIAKEYKDRMKFARLNVLKNKDNRNVAVKYGLVSTPSLVFFYKGKAVATKVGGDGFETKKGFKQLIDNMINKYTKRVK